MPTIELRETVKNGKESTTERELRIKTYFPLEYGFLRGRIREFFNNGNGVKLAGEDDGKSEPEEPKTEPQKEPEKKQQRDRKGHFLSFRKPDDTKKAKQSEPGSTKPDASAKPRYGRQFD